MGEDVYHCIEDNRERNLFSPLPASRELFSVNNSFQCPDHLMLDVTHIPPPPHISIITIYKPNIQYLLASLHPHKQGEN